MTTATPTQGDVLAGKYRVERVLGSGGMGFVVEAVHVQLAQRVAIKFMHERALEDPAMTGRFAREGRAIAQLRGEHVVRVLDVGNLENGAPYIVMEFLDGTDLRTTLRKGPLSFDDAMRYMLDACEGMAEAHAAGIVHRDLKPHNLFLVRTPKGKPSIKVLDFGVAKVADPALSADEGLTHTQTMLGSPKYMAPEQLLSSRAVDSRADVWALGVCLYQFLAGRLPFESENGVVALGAMILKEPPAPLPSHRPDVPPDLCAVVMRCLEKEPARRFADASELGAALEQVAATHGWASISPSDRNIPALGGSHVAASTPAVPVHAGFESAAHPSDPGTSPSHGNTNAVWNQALPSGGKSPLAAVLAVCAVLLVGGIGASVVILTRRPQVKTSALTSASVSSVASVEAAAAPLPTEPSELDASSASSTSSASSASPVSVLPSHAASALGKNRPIPSAIPGRRGSQQPSGKPDDILNHL